jgi:hypothetical protein
VDAALLTAAGGFIGALVGAGALWRAWQSDRQSLVQSNIRDLWAENRLLRQELDTERQERSESERRMRDDMSSLAAKVERCEAEKDGLARELAELKQNGF